MLYEVKVSLLVAMNSQGFCTMFFPIIPKNDWAVGEGSFACRCNMKDKK